MRDLVTARAFALALVVSLTARCAAARAQQTMPDMPDMPGMSMPAQHEGEHQHELAPAAHPDEHAHAAMTGLLGTYPASREASGTAWQPEAAPHGGVHVTRGPWHVMAHATAFGLFTDQGSDRGDEALVSTNWAMASAQRPLGAGRLGLVGMVSLEPATVGSRGYPLLLQTGETANGRTPIVDRQHPHDLLMELAATYAVPVRASDSLFVYVGLPGEPALGPAAYMHRASALDDPETPLAHHWLDSTHVSFGVVTAGWTGATWKAEVSAFRGREPDEHRWDLEEPGLDSGSLRWTWNPSAHWSAQASWGRLHSPEQLEPEVDVDRTTVSVSYVAPAGAGLLATTFAWGRNDRRPGRATDAWLLEGAWSEGATTLFARAERLRNDELLGDLAADGAHSLAASEEERAVAIGEVSLGFVRDLLRRGPMVLGAGASARVSFVPDELVAAYGERRPLSGLVMVRAAVR